MTWTQIQHLLSHVILRPSQAAADDLGSLAVIEEGCERGYPWRAAAPAEDQDRREALIALGMHPAEGFTWRRTAEHTAEVYRQFIS